MSDVIYEVTFSQGTIPIHYEIGVSQGDSNLEITYNQENALAVELVFAGVRGEQGPIGPVGPIGPTGPQGEPAYTPTSPVFSYSGGQLTLITYEDGATKSFSYTGARLDRIDFLRDGVTIRKDFAYTGDRLDSITQTMF